MNDSDLIDWLENSKATLTHNSTSCSVDMGGNCWSIYWQDYSKRPAKNRVNGKSVREVICKAMNDLTENKGENLLRKLNKECLDW